MANNTEIWRSKFLELAKPGAGVGRTMTAVARATGAKEGTVQTALHTLVRNGDRTLASKIAETRKPQSERTKTLPKAAAKAAEEMRFVQFISTEINGDGSTVIAKRNATGTPMLLELTKAETTVVRNWLAEISEE